MSRIDARVRVVDTDAGRTFIERFDATPIRIGRALDSDLVLPHPAIAARHGEIAIGQRFAYFRSRAWLRPSRIDGVRIRRGLAVRLTDESVITLGPYEFTVWFRARDRRYERDRKVTPLALGVVRENWNHRSTPGPSVPLVREARIGDHPGAWGGDGAQTSRRLIS
jgi:pSer/pThr/pTyr-binding forkhead associated (FHA) protein